MCLIGATVKPAVAGVLAVVADHGPCGLDARDHKQGIDSGQCRRRAATEISQHLGEIVHHQVVTAMRVEAVAPAEVRQGSGGQAQLATRLGLPAISLTVVPSARITGQHTVGAGARNGHGEVIDAVERAVDIEVLFHDQGGDITGSARGCEQLQIGGRGRTSDLSLEFTPVKGRHRLRAHQRAREVRVELSVAADMSAYLRVGGRGRTLGIEVRFVGIPGRAQGHIADKQRHRDEVCRLKPH